MTHDDHNMLESIMHRLDQIGETLRHAASNEDGMKRPIYRLCGELLDEQVDRMDEVLNQQVQS